MTSSEASQPRIFSGRQSKKPGQKSTWRQRPFRALRRKLVYYGFVAPGLWMLLHAPGFIIRFVLRGIIEPIAHLTLRGQIRENLDRVFGEEKSAAELKAMTRAVTHNLVTALHETSQTLRRGAETANEFIDDAEAIEKLHAIEAMSERGVVGITAHIGNWELMGSWLARRSSKKLGAVIGKRVPNPLIDARLDAIRQSLGMRTFYRDEGTSVALRMIRKGEHVCALPDQDVKELGGIFIDFLGHQAYTPVGPARMAIASNTVMACGFAVRQPNGRLKIVIGDPIFPDRNAPRDEELMRLTRAWSKAVEDIIREYPDQWAWFHRRWRTTPEKLERQGRREG